MRIFLFISLAIPESLQNSSIRAILEIKLDSTALEKNIASENTIKVLKSILIHIQIRVNILSCILCAVISPQPTVVIHYTDQLTEFIYKVHISASYKPSLIKIKQKNLKSLLKNPCSWTQPT